MRACLAGALALSFLVSTAPEAAAKRLDGYCGVDSCAGIWRRPNGTIVFRASGYADYFGTITVCVRKDTEKCVRMYPREDSGLWLWKLRWQGNFPDQGVGVYEVRMRASDGSLVGGRVWSFTLS